MSDRNKDPTGNDHETSEELVSFVSGSSVIDIGELRRAQLNEDAREILEEFENDPEMKTDVLEAYSVEDSDDNLERIAEAVQNEDDKHLAAMESLALETAGDLKEFNDTLIKEDLLLENADLRREVLGSVLGGSESGDEEEALTEEEMSEEDAALRAALPRADENGTFDSNDLQSCIDTLLFYSDRPISLKRIKDMLEISEASDTPLLEAIESLKISYQTANRGFEIAEIAGGYQFRTKITKAPLLRKLAKVQVQRLSRGAMETLTICAYKQPCTKDDIDQVRGVDSSHFIRTLLDRKLIEVSGRSEAPGRPMIYSTTDTFLEVFGMMNLGGLPPLREIEAMVPQMAATEEGGEDPRVIQMRKMVGQMKIESNHLDYDAKEDERILQEIRDRVKSIDVSTPYLERQKALAEQGITGEEAEELLAKEFGFDSIKSGGEPVSGEAASQSEEQLSLDELRQIARLNAVRNLETEVTTEE